MKDGIRVYVELVEVVTSGPYYDRMARKLAQSPYSHHPLKDCLVFRWHFSCVCLGPTGSLPVGGRYSDPMITPRVYAHQSAGRLSLGRI